MKKNNKKDSGNTRHLLKKLVSPKLWRKITSVLLAVTVFLTTYMMILPALTIDLDTVVSEPGMDVAVADSKLDMPVYDDSSGLPSTGESQTFMNNELPESAEGALSGSSAYFTEDFLPVSDISAENIDVGYTDETIQGGIDITASEDVDTFLPSEEPEAVPFEDEPTLENETVQNEEIPDLEITEDYTAPEMFDDSLILPEEVGGELTEASDEFPEEEAEVLPADEQESVEDATEPAEFALDSAETEENATEEREGEENNAEEPSVSSHVLKAEGEDYRVTVSYGDEAEIPEGAELLVTEILSDETGYEQYVNEASEALSTEKRIMSVENARFFDITIIKENEPVEPKAPVTVLVELADSFAAEESATVIHYTEDEVKVVETVDPEEVAASIEEAEAADAEVTQTEDDAEETDISDTAVEQVLDTVETSPEEASVFEEGYEGSLEEITSGMEDELFIGDEIPPRMEEEPFEEAETTAFAEEVPFEGAETAVVAEEASFDGAETAVVAGEVPFVGAVPAEETDESNVFDESMNPIAFVADSFSVYGFVTATIDKTILASDGNNYKVSVTCGADAGLPEGADLSVEEITQGTPEYDAYVADLENVFGKGEKRIEYVRLFDIKIVDPLDDTVKYQPAEGSQVDVRIELADTMDKELSVVHYGEDEAEGVILDAGTDEGEEGSVVEFKTDGFSVFAVAYTVDFSYEVNGKTYEFSIPGGGFLRLTDLVEVLGIGAYMGSSNNAVEALGMEEEPAVPERQDFTEVVEEEEIPVNVRTEDSDTGADVLDMLNDTAGTDATDTYDDVVGSDTEDTLDEEAVSDAADTLDEIAVSDAADTLNDVETSNAPLTLNDVVVSDAARMFVADVESVSFSDPELVWVDTVEELTNIGGIKSSQGLECQYSAGLTEDQIAEINNSTVEAGDWVLISMRPFSSEETLTVTMKNGEVFTIRVTDAQIKKTVIDAKGDTWEITVTYDEKAQIPEGAELKVEEILPEDEEYEQYYRQSLMKAGVKGASDYARIFNIEIWADIQKVEPAADVTVDIKLLDAPEETEATPQVVHFAKDGAELIELSEDAEDSKVKELRFVTNEFSVYSVVYTVDFHWNVNGNTYEMNVPGGDTISMKELVEQLHILDGEENDQTESATTDTSEKTKATTPETIISFINDIAKAEFSDESLVKVARISEEITAGELKASLSLKPEYSAELTEEKIAEMDAKVLTAPDWALICLKAFTTEETLTVTMKDGEVFSVIVTDAQGVGNALADKTKVISYNNYAMNSSIKDFGAFDVELPASSEGTKWTFEYLGDNDYYIRANNGKYIQIDTSNGKVSLESRTNATRFKIETENGKYRFRVRGYSTTYHNYYDAPNYLDYSEGSGYPFFNGVYSENNSSIHWLDLSDYNPVPERVGDWLLYFDDDFDEITIHVGETITLRPYNKWEWKEGSIDVQTAHWNVGGSAWNNWSISGSDGNGSKLSTATDGPFVFTRYVKEDNQLDTHYWSVQGRATQTGDYTLTNTKNGKTITVHVVDGAPVNKPNTINKIANIKVNLFDYDREYLLDPTSNNNLANNNNNKNDSVNKMGGSDHFYFLSSGSGNNGNEPWNSYTKDRANPNIVKNNLDSEGYPVLNHGRSTSLKYLFDKSQTAWHGGNNSDGMIAYPDIVGMFQKDNDGYYYYNSNTNYYYYDTAAKTSKLYEHTYTQTSSEAKGSLVNDKPIGFFPFHDYDATSNLYVNQNHALNHHVGMSMEVEFMLSADRRDDYGKPIIFDFSGDDDLWVFAEWTDDNGNKQSQLLLDLGGVHQPIHGQINFTNGANTAFMETNRPYTLKVFYLERGGCDSNCSIRFNLPVIQDLTVAKKLTGLTEAEKAKYKNEEFTYEIVVNGQPYSGPNNWEKTVRRNAAGVVVEENFTITDGKVTIKDGETVTISYLDRSDKFSVAEIKTPNMENFEVPNAERYYHLPHDASLYEEEIALTPGRTIAAPITDDWVTPVYELEDTEKVTFTNTLKEKNLEVEKKWLGEQEHPNSVTFTVSATVDDGTGGRTPYAVSVLKEENGTTDRVFTLNDSNKWRYEIEHLPVNTPEGKFIFYDINEGYVEGYALTGVTDLTAESYNYCNVDVVKLWPDSNEEHNDVIEAILRNSDGKYYAGTGADGEAVFADSISGAQIFELTRDNNYAHRIARVLAGDYYAEQINEDDYTEGLATYVRNIIQYELENAPVNGPVDPTDKPNVPEIHKRIDALRDGAVNPDSPHTNEDLTDLYRLYLDYKVNSLQEASGVDLLFVIDHSGSMNNTEWQGNPYRAPAVEAALNGDDGLISEFLDMNDKNQWAAVGFKGPDGSANYYWSLSNPWQPATEKSRYNAGINGSEVLSPGGTDYAFTRTNVTSGKNVALNNEGPNILTNYTAGLWRAEQFLLKQSVKEDGRKKVIVFISDGIPTLHINCPNGTLQDAGTANGSPYYRDAYGGCPTETLQEFGYFVNDMRQNGYTFGDNMEFFTIGFGGTMQTQSGSELLNGMLDIAYGQTDHSHNFMTISDTYYSPGASVIDYSEATENLKNNLRTIMGMNEKFTNIVIQDDLSAYVDLYGIAEAGTDAAIMRNARAKVTMSIPDSNTPGGTQTITLYENGAPSTDDNAKFTKADNTKATIIRELRYDAATKTVKAVFDPEYKAAAGTVYTLSFDVRATDTAYSTYAAGGYDKYASGENEGQIITGDPDTDFLGTTPANATSVDKEGFRSNDEAKVTYKHNSDDEEMKYPHPVIQVAAKADIVKIDQTGAALEEAKFNLYDSDYDVSKTVEENAVHLIEENLQSKKPTNPAGQDAVVRSGKLTPGTYYLVETKTPAGYILLPGPVKITVTEVNGILSMTAEINGSPLGNKLEKVGHGVWKLKVQNSKGYELPNTGGNGTRLFTILGSILILGSVVMLWRRRKVG